MNLKASFAHSTKWSVLSGVFLKIIGVITTVILARILSPTEFGLFALAFVVIDGFGLFKSLGFESALVQTRKDLAIASDTAFFIIPGMGLLVYAALVLSLPFVEVSFHSAELTRILKVLGALFIFNTLSRVPLSLLQRNLKFAERSIIDIASQLTNSVLAVVLAMMGFGVWSLVAGYLAMTVITTVMAWHYAQWTPRFHFDKGIAVDMFHFGKYIFISGLLYFVYKNFDRIVVAKIISVEALGVYALAFNLSNLITEYVGLKIGDVLFPVYSKLQDNYHDLSLAYMKVFKGLLLITLPVSLGLFFLGGDLLKILFGQKWLAAIPVLQILAPLSIPNIISSSVGSIFLGIKKAQCSLISQVLRIVIYALLIIPLGLRYGVQGIAWVVLLSSTVAMVYGLIMVNHYIGLRWRDLFDSTKNLISATLVMAAGFWITELAAANISMPIVARFLMMAVLSTGIYCFIVWKSENDFIRVLRSMAFKNSSSL